MSKLDAFKSHHDLFTKIGESYIHPKQFGECIWPVSIEDLYQAFKARMLAESASSQETPVAPLKHPNEVFRWICVHCEAVNGNDITQCLGCKRDRYPSLNRRWP